MGNRLTKIYTRTGDDGSTGLADGNRIKKSSRRIEAIGDIDELNSSLGVLIADLAGHNRESANQIQAIQHRLFDLGGELSIPDALMIDDEHVTQLEVWIDQINAELSPLKEFILPGGSMAAAQCFLARAICRRSERRLIALQDDETVNPSSIRYINRLSDLLFVMARAFNSDNGLEEIFWRKGV